MEAQVVDKVYDDNYKRTMKIMINDIYIVVTNLKNQQENRLADERD